MENRSLVLNVVLSIITCGIYALYWFYTIARDFENAQTYNRVATTAGVTLLLDIVTCGIYGIYAYYKWGQATPELFARYGRTSEDKSVLYLVLAILGLQIVNMCLIQSDLNQLASSQQQPPYPPQQPPYDPPPPPAYRP